MTAYVHTTSRICSILIALAIMWGIIGLSAKPGCTGGNEALSTYRNGDYATALREVLPLAHQGDSWAQGALGFLYDLGRGAPQDYAKAAYWYQRAANQGDAGAQFNLGVLYENGQGVPQDAIQAYVWFNLAAANFPGTAREWVVQSRNRVATRLSPTQLAEAQARASRWQPKPEPQALPSHQQFMLFQASPRRDLVRQVQTRLQVEGFNPGTIDGTLGPQTQQALRWFQNARGLRATGDLDSPTLDALGVR